MYIHHKVMTSQDMYWSWSNC